MNPLLSQAIAFQQQGNWQKALTLYQEILESDPQNEIALVNQGILLFQYQTRQKGLQVLCHAVTLHPHSANAQFNYAYALLETQQFQQASLYFQKVIKIQPNFYNAYLNLGKIYHFLGQDEVANDCFEKAYSLNSQSLELLNNWTITCISLKRFEQGSKILKKALQLYPNQWTLYGNQATIFKEQWHLPLAEEAFKKAIALNSNEWQLYHGLAAVYHHWNKKKEALNCLQKALNLNSNNPQLYSDYLYHLNYYPDIVPQTLFELHQEWGRKFIISNQFLTFNNEYYSENKPLKVGLLSADFCYHPVAIFLLGWLDKINSHNLQFFAYAQVRNRDHYTQKFKEICHWYETNGQSDLNVAQQIYQDKIDILIDLAGHTAGNRLGIMGLKPAPIQISYLGYINTTGLTQIDYRIVDPYVNPPETQQYYTEKLVYLPESYTCYHPPETQVAISSLPALKNGFITFGCYNNPAKLNPQVVELWAKILQAIPTAKLRLKARHFRDEQSKASILNLFYEEGIENNRLILDGISVLKDYFEAYNYLDIALDPFPHNGGTTTHDALYMGVPVITLEGKTYVSRMGVSILNNLGHPEWIAKTKIDYINIAIALASNVNQLQRYRQHLRREFLNSSLCNGKKFAKDMENLLWQLSTTDRKK